ncbi:MAG: M23 family metallopeptidase, partial [Bacteroidota bacterium]
MLRLLPLALLLVASGARGQTLADGGGSLTPSGPDGPSPEVRTSIDADVAALRSSMALRGTTTSFAWPVRDRDAAPVEPIGISNYVDLDVSGGLQDWSCGQKTYNGHNGTDIFLWPFSWALMDANRVEVVAAAAGTIASKQDGNGDRQCTWENAPPGNGIVILHDDGSQALYWHFRTNSITSKSVGERVEVGEYLGLVGSSGTSTGPHLHFEVWDASGNVVDPYEGQCNGGGTWW